MSGDVLRSVIGLAVLAHGIGHVLFMPFLNGTLRLQADGHSWILSGVLGDGATKGLATLVAAVAGALFIAAGVGVLGQTAWWRQLAVIAAAASLAVIVVMWDGVPTSSAFFALVFDVVVLAALLFAHWPSTETIGA